MPGCNEVIEGDAEVLAALRDRVRRRGESKRFAHEAGLSAGAISQIARGYRPPSESVARALGFRKISRWVRA
ncbi:MAG: hypothetical protein JWN59_1755 [Sphingomonas bacterium]|jgi:transcriptional regulator with XRE-family HTH domain|nr:hypothetical protein [Sphingomonas bacterium]MDB5683554.1 hypothetical protein [Sphingomonas bacterium]